MERRQPSSFWADETEWMIPIGRIPEGSLERERVGCMQIYLCISIRDTRLGRGEDTTEWGAYRVMIYFKDF